MGAILCFRSSKNKEDTNAELVSAVPDKKTEKVYSWDKKNRSDLHNYIIQDIVDTICGKTPNSINGEQFIVQNCTNSKIYLLDFIGTLTIDDCENCQFIIGPVKASVFVRNCKNCVLMVACQQFRTRDCDRLTVFLSCATVPVIENTCKFKVGPYQLHYKDLEAQFEASDLSVFNCNWSEIHDFTPVTDGGLNYRLLEPSVRPFSLIQTPDTVDGGPACGDNTDQESEAHKPVVDYITRWGITDSTDSSLVPYTYPISQGRLAPAVAVCSLVIVMTHDRQQQLALDIIRHLSKTVENCRLVKTNKMKISFEIAKAIFGEEVQESHPSLKGPIVYLEFDATMSLVETINSWTTTLNLQQPLSTVLYVAADPDSAQLQADIVQRQFKSGLNLAS